ncbi:MAG TPA: large conductance mechanosensitive channel protein MscL [Candidatus Paceibacterota bacterium]|nr:large conductance mechanosensitive channel protein MscL [Candidatus Paceibacterota bacterium]
MLKQKVTGFFADFRNFAVKGNAFDLAVAVVIGNAFTAIVNSLVGDVITPLLGIVTGSVDLKSLAWTVRPDLVVKYGALLQATFNFLLVSLSIFIVFRLLTAARKRVFREGEKAVPEHEKPAQERLLEEIRDLLKARQQ